MIDKEKTFKVDNEISNKNEKKDKKNQEEKMSYNKIIDEIDKEKNHVKFVETLRDEFISMNKSFTRCLDLLALSVKGPKINSKIEEIMSNNMASIAGVCDTLDTEKVKSKNRINDLYYKKDNFGKDEKE